MCRKGYGDRSACGGVTVMKLTNYCETLYYRIKDNR